MASSQCIFEQNVIIIILVRPPGVVCLSNRGFPMVGTADGDAISRCRILGGNPHFNMFNLDQPTCLHNRLSAFQVVQGFSAPAGRCSSGLMLRCTLSSRGSSRSLHSSMRASFAVVLMGSVHFFRDFRRGTTPRCPLSKCRWSVVCRVRSVRLATNKE